MTIFPGLEDSDNPIPPLPTYIRYLADQGNTILLIALTRSQLYTERYEQLNAAITAAEQSNDEPTLLALLDEAGDTWDSAANYDQEIALLTDTRLN